MNTNPRYRTKDAFTFIELLMVVLIVGVLAAMVVPRLSGRSEQARIGAAQADIEATLALALDSFELDIGRYPTTEEGLAVLRQFSGEHEDRWRGPYLNKIPSDPWGSDYVYKSPGSHGNDYDLYSLGPNGNDGDEDDVTNWQ